MERMFNPVVFLDFDGVLNTEQYQAELAINGQLNRDKWGLLFSPKAVSNLKKIVDATNASIVVTSTWRYIHGLHELKEMWEERSLPGKLMGILPCDSLQPTRGEEISEYLSGLGKLSYVILDDVNEFDQTQFHNLVLVNPVIGISNKDAQKAISILNKVAIE